MLAPAHWHACCAAAVVCVQPVLQQHCHQLQSIVLALVGTTCSKAAHMRMVCKPQGAFVSQEREGLITLCNKLASMLHTRTCMHHQLLHSSQVIAGATRLQSGKPSCRHIKRSSRIHKARACPCDSPGYRLSSRVLLSQDRNLSCRCSASASSSTAAATGPDPGCARADSRLREARGRPLGCAPPARQEIRMRAA